MRKLLIAGLVLAGFLVACDNKSPTGPGSVTVTTPAPATTTTSVPGTVPPTVPPTTTTSIPTPATVRTFVGFGTVSPAVPNQLTMVLQSAGTRASLVSQIAGLFEKEADPVWSVTGFWRNAAGGGGQVTGQFVGTFENGDFRGYLTAESPECIAERVFFGTVDSQFLRWTGGETLSDCKGSPLGFNTLLMIATNAPPPTTIPVSTTTTTIPLQCSYGLSASSVSVESSGGQRTVGVTTSPTCGWSVQNFVDWINVQPATGLGAGTVSITVAENPGPPRSATIVIAGLTLVVNQGMVTTTTTTSSTTTSVQTTTSIATTTVPLPDLAPYTPTGSFCRTGSSGTLLYVTVRNQGNAGAGGSITRVVFDTSSASATVVDRVTPAIDAGQQADLNYNVPYPCSVSSACSFLIVADQGNSIVESNEGNNTAQATCNFGTSGNYAGFRPEVRGPSGRR